jgi:hypothetical protein
MAIECSVEHLPAKVSAGRSSSVILLEISWFQLGDAHPSSVTVS